ncbi:MAG: ROK family protein, partial [Anaerotignaceae bacterium]
DIKHVGIGSYGTVDQEHGILVYSSHFSFRDVNLFEEVTKHINLPVYIDNDANCYALAESNYGSTAGYDNSVIVTIGTTISGGMILNNKVYHGAFYGAGELGHHVICFDGEKCECGRNGCWAAYASTTSLVRDARIASIRHPESEMFKLVNGDVRLMSYEIPFKAAQKGDEYAKNLVHIYNRYVAVGLINIINIFQPSAIAIGGNMRKLGDIFINDVERLVKEKTFGQQKTKILLAKMDYDAVIIGATLLEEQFRS